MDFESAYWLQAQRAMKEIEMWRKHYINVLLFVDSEEEEWFTEKLMTYPAGIESIDEYVNCTLKCYRETKEENK